MSHEGEPSYGEIAEEEKRAAKSVIEMLVRAAKA